MNVLSAIRIHASTTIRHVTRDLSLFREALQVKYDGWVVSLVCFLESDQPDEPNRPDGPAQLGKHERRGSIRWEAGGAGPTRLGPHSQNQISQYSCLTPYLHIQMLPSSLLILSPQVVAWIYPLPGHRVRVRSCNPTSARPERSQQPVLFAPDATIGARETHLVARVLRSSFVARKQRKTFHE